METSSIMTKAVVFAYSNIGCVGIEALLRAGVEITAIFTHHDNPNENIWFNSVAELAAENEIPVFAPDDVNHQLWLERIRKSEPDFIFSFYYRNLLSEEILTIPSSGALNLHGSLLPKYRGRAPINWAVINGEKETGVTLHYMTARPDAGDIVGQKSFPIEENDTAKIVHLKAAKSAAELLDELLPSLLAGKAPRIPQNEAEATLFHGRKPADGLIDWTKQADEVRNLVRGVTRPYPGAFTFISAKKYFIWDAAVKNTEKNEPAGTILSVNPLIISCGKDALEIKTAQAEDGIFSTGAQIAKENCFVQRMRCTSTPVPKSPRKKNILILGVNGFIGNALSRRLLQSGKYEVYGLDLRNDYNRDIINHPNFHFYEGDIQICNEWIEYHVRKCDVVVPLVAIATPIEYTRNPLRVFELDFEENLKIVRYCHKYGKRLIFPSTSEVYALCDDEEFNEDTSRLILGPICKQRWIYSCIKQMLDRVIWAYGTKGLQFTLFRPFNWIGPKLDSLTSARIGSSRAITQMILNLVQGNPIQLIDGGAQKRCFTDIDEGIECLYRIIENEGNRCDGKIINIGNPNNEMSIKDFAHTLIELFNEHPLRNHFPPVAGCLEIESGSYYGKGYQDCSHRKPSIKNAEKYCGWHPVIPLRESMARTLDFFLNQAVESGEFLFEQNEN